MTDWRFSHTVFSKAARNKAWSIWSSMKYQSNEPGVVKIELDGPFETGTSGRTIMETHTQEWQLTKVEPGFCCVIRADTPGNGYLQFTWKFEEAGDGTRISQLIEAAGPMVNEFRDELLGMEQHAPKAMEDLARRLEESN